MRIRAAFGQSRVAEQRAAVEQQEMKADHDPVQAGRCDDTGGHEGEDPRRTTGISLDTRAEEMRNRCANAKMNVRR